MMMKQTKISDSDCDCLDCMPEGGRGELRCSDIHPGMTPATAAKTAAELDAIERSVATLRRTGLSGLADALEARYGLAT